MRQRGANVHEQTLGNQFGLGLLGDGLPRALHGRLVTAPFVLHPMSPPIVAILFLIGGIGAGWLWGCAARRPGTRSGRHGLLPGIPDIDGCQRQVHCGNRMIRYHSRACGPVVAG